MLRFKLQYMDGTDGGQHWRGGDYTVIARAVFYIVIVLETYNCIFLPTVDFILFSFILQHVQ